MNDINKSVEEINKENVIRFGPLCSECGSFERYCRCESTKDFEEFMSVTTDKTYDEWKKMK